jgi:hypothetical protein
MFKLLIFIDCSYLYCWCMFHLGWLNFFSGLFYDRQWSFLIHSYIWILTKRLILFWLTFFIKFTVNGLATSEIDLKILFWYSSPILVTWCIFLNSFYPKWTIIVINSASMTIWIFTTCWNSRIKITIDFQFQMKTIIFWSMRFKSERI